MRVSWGELTSCASAKCCAMAASVQHANAHSGHSNDSTLAGRASCCSRCSCSRCSSCSRACCSSIRHRMTERSSSPVSSSPVSGGRGGAGSLPAYLPASLSRARAGRGCASAAVCASAAGAVGLFWSAAGCLRAWPKGGTGGSVTKAHAHVGERAGEEEDEAAAEEEFEEPLFDSERAIMRAWACGGSFAEEPKSAKVKVWSSE
mmetsp:Transcript_12641/g.29672  ORF Transcript_12641/g.29672 Transcript_12641/m.29672 type:complete len:204 (+) Transcript_12641:1114-1725(+)